MVKHLFSISIAFLISIELASAQNIGDWNLYSSYSSTNSLVIIPDGFIASTGGGVIQYNGGEINTINVTDGLYGNDVMSVFYSIDRDLIFLGYEDGTIDILNQQNEIIKRLDDIRRVERFESKKINGFRVNESSLFVATGFGLVEYDLSNYLVKNSYFRFGEFDAGIGVSDLLIKQDSLYITTSQGVAIADLNSELINNDVWDTYNDNEGLFSPAVEKIITFSDSVYVLNEQRVSVFRNESWSGVFSEINAEIIDLNTSTNEQELVILTDDIVYVYDRNYTSTTNNVGDINGKRLIGISTDKFTIGTAYTGIYTLDRGNNDIEQILPQGPQFNYLNNLLIDDEVLIGTSSSEFPGIDPLNPFRGYSIYDGNNWNNYNRLYNQELSFIETVYSVGQTTDYYYMGSWGDGVIQHRKSDNSIEVYNATNSSLTGITSDNEFVVISGLSNDSQDNIWAVSYLSENPLNVLQASSTEWKRFKNVTDSDNYYKLFIDSNDQKWISLITNTNSGLGLLIMDTNSPDTEGDDEFIKLTDNPERGNLPHPKVNVIIEDKNGEIWIGTERGIARFIFPEFIINGSANERQAQWLINEDTTATSRFLLRDLNVSSIAVNPANQKWVGSRNQGLWLLNSEGSRILKRITAENSNLISNNINDIKVNKNTGEVFISTDAGLTSYQDIPKASANNMNRLKVYPNPFRYEDHDKILIEGLSEETTVKVVGIDGFVVNELVTRGGRVSWNARDSYGKKVGTGVYYIIANSADGGEKGIGKVVIVN